jgi:hypothetical protein
MITLDDGPLARIERCRDFRRQRIDGAFERRFVNRRRRIVLRVGKDARKDGVRIRQDLGRRLSVVTAERFDRF